MFYNYPLTLSDLKRRKILHTFSIFYSWKLYKSLKNIQFFNFKHFPFISNYLSGSVALHTWISFLFPASQKYLIIRTKISICTTKSLSHTKNPPTHTSQKHNLQQLTNLIFISSWCSRKYKKKLMIFFWPNKTEIRGEPFCLINALIYKHAAQENWVYNFMNEWKNSFLLISPL